MASLLDLAQARLGGLLAPQRPSMAGLLGGRQPTGTLAGALQGYTPPQMTAMTNPQVMDYARNVAQTAQQNLQTQMSDLDKALVMDQGGINVGDRQALARLLEQVPGLMGATAYHGTPHNIRGQFDISKVGTGEGAQAYGHGMYFAESPSVASGYAKTLGQRKAGYEIDGVRITPEKGSIEDMAVNLATSASGVNAKNPFEYAKNRALELVKKNPQMQEVAKKIEELQSLGANLKTSGNLYKVDIPDEYIPNMLDWDKPISQQPTVMKALRSEAEQRVKSRVLDNLENEIRSSLPPIDIGNDYMAMFSDANVKAGQEIKKQALEKLKKMDLSTQFDKELESMKPRDMNWNMTGKEFYEFMLKNQGSAAKASELLQNQGVPGIRYLDEGSRSSGKGTSNYVVFDPTDVKILEKNSQKVEGLLD